jgi:hypothetical protein
MLTHWNFSGNFSARCEDRLTDPSEIFALDFKDYRHRSVDFFLSAWPSAAEGHEEKDRQLL